MATLRQAFWGLRSKKKKNSNMISRLRGLKFSPQRRGIIVELRIMKPRKPNSALRKVARIKLSTGYVILAYIPGQGNSLQDHANVLVRGGRTKDLPGLRYKVMRGHLDFDYRETFVRRNRLTKYGYPRLK